MNTKPTTGKASALFLATHLMSIILCLGEDISPGLKAEVNALRTEMEARVERIPGAYAELSEKYRSALTRQLARLQEAGDLDGVIAFRQEIQALDESPSKFPPAHETAYDEIKKLRQIAIEQKTLPEQERLKAILATKNPFVRTLQEKVTDLTRRNELTDALWVKSQLDQIEEQVATIKGLIAEDMIVGNKGLQLASRAISEGRIGSTITVSLSNNIALAMNWCPPGSFKMGSPSSETGRGGDETEVQVTISKGFWLGKTEVTQAQWEAVMGKNPSFHNGADLPVELVSWDDAQAFIKKVNDSGVVAGGWKMALPTEAQWEYACRAGETGPYSGGTLDEVGWYNKNSGKKTYPVGTKQPNSWGFHDMHGNVLEWCADWHDDYPDGLTVDPKGPPMGVRRVYRGGSWYDTAAKCRAAHRMTHNPTSKDRNLGFRLALLPEK